jgi:ribosomal protein S18 acetylase RimI-like enzyme
MTPEKAHSQGMIIREFRIEDYPSLIRLWEEAKLPHKPEGRDSRESIRNELKGETSLFLVAEINERIVGSVFGTHDGRKGWINRLAVDPEFRRKGVGKALVSEVEKQLSAMGIGIMACLIEDWNKNSLRVFRRLGYTRHPDIIYFTKREHPEI